MPYFIKDDHELCETNSHSIHGRTIKFANSPPCACRGSTGQKP